MKTLAKLTHHAANALLYAAAGGLVLMTVIVGWQVFGRYVLNSSPSWSEQASQTLMIWYVAFAAATGVREGFHIRIVAVEAAVSPRFAKGMRLTSNLVVSLCGIAMLVWGGELVSRTWAHVIPSLGISRGFAYLGLPIAGVLIVVFGFERFLEELVSENRETEETSRWS